MGLTHKLLLKLNPLSIAQAGGITSVPAKCLDTRTGTSGEGGLLDDN